MKAVKTKLLNNKKYAPDYFEMEFRWPREWGIPEPGQFCTIRPDSNSAPLLRRPFAFSGYDRERETAKVLIQSRGKGTELLEAKLPDADLEILGPLGTSFPRDSGSEYPLCIAGGIGLGPILYLFEKFKEENKAPLLIIGFRDKNRIPGIAPEEKEGEVVLCTDDGSAGFSGTVAEYLLSLNENFLAASRLFSCGPHGMLKACHNIALKKNLQNWVSVEEMMACGIGACAGCVFPKPGGESYFKVCKDGPVFESRQVLWT